MPWSERVQTIALFLKKPYKNSSKNKSEKHFARNAENCVFGNTDSKCEHSTC